MNRGLLMLLVLGLTGCGSRIDKQIADPRARALKQLVEAIPAAYNGKKALVVVNPLGKGQREVAALEAVTLEALDKVLNGRLSVTTATPALRPGATENPAGFKIPPGSTAPISFLMADDAFSQLAAKHPKASLIISLVGYPVGGLRQSHPPAVLLFPDVQAFESKEAMLTGFADGHLLAFVLPGGLDGPRVITRENAADVAWKK
jgi:hypothetical protein